MLKLMGGLLLKLSNRGGARGAATMMGKNKIDISPPVQKALREKRPIVALESTIITHGMSYPENMRTANEVEELVRMNGATPATIAVIDGRVKVGLSEGDLLKLACASDHHSDKQAKQTVLKCSRRDLPVLLATGRSGGTTVAATMLIAHLAGIRIFATGGIGGVHRDGHITMDVSADLVELGRTPVAVVCSGVKSILDVQRTLEYLETQGVCVVTFGSEGGRFPDFYTRDSDCYVPYDMQEPAQVARLIEGLECLNLQSGLLVAVPIPAEYAADKAVIAAAIKQAHADAAQQNVIGKDVTPYLLAAIAQITKGDSLKANMALIKNNATVAAQIACELAAHRNIYYDLPPSAAGEEPPPPSSVSDDVTQPPSSVSSDVTPPPLVIGASIMDLCLTLKEEMRSVLDGATYQTRTKQTAGGVGRNLAEGLLKLYGSVKFISAVGNDQLGASLMGLMPLPLQHDLIVDELHSTSLCSLIIDRRGDCKLGLGNMDIHERIMPSHVRAKEPLLSHTPLIVMDGNLSLPTIECILQLAIRHRRLVLFEPTDMHLAGRPFASLPRSLTQQIQIITPNLYELMAIAGPLTGATAKDICLSGIAEHTSVLVEKTISVLAGLREHFNCVLVTLGHHGVLLMLRGTVDDETPLLERAQGLSGGVFAERQQDMRQHSIRFYHAPRVDGIVNVSGAGDSYTSGFITGALRGYAADRCCAMGFLAAERALKAESAVPDIYFENNKQEMELVHMALAALRKTDYEVP